MEKVTEINCETGEIIERKRTPEEAQVLAQSAQIAEQEQALIDSAHAKLLTLGLTEDEVLAIIGRA
jgi:hypothetical protein